MSAFIHRKDCIDRLRTGYSSRSEAGGGALSSLDPCGPVSPGPIPILSVGGGIRRRPVMQPLPVAVDLHADVLGVPHDCSLDEALHVVSVCVCDTHTHTHTRTHTHTHTRCMWWL